MFSGRPNSNRSNLWNSEENLVEKDDGNDVHNSNSFFRFSVVSIINMSSQEFTCECKSLLAKGCKFTSHPKANMTSLCEDVTEFNRNVE